MPKTTLSLDTLEVSSFATSPGPADLTGNASWFTLVPSTRSCAWA